MKNIIQVVQVSLNSQQLLDMVMQQSNLETNAAITNLCERWYCRDHVFGDYFVVFLAAIFAFFASSVVASNKPSFENKHFQTFLMLKPGNQQ